MSQNDILFTLDRESSEFEKQLERYFEFENASKQELSDELVDRILDFIIKAV